ncbi:MAG TPA: hypothetical protein VKU83_07910, partial [Puia sp.]|nr:hypothetical protein [Puia sp.]
NLGILIICLFLSGLLNAQDTLPRFSAIVRGPGKVLISWHNRYPVVSQISIQRSADSLRNFTTLLTVPDPALPENGAVDSRSPQPGLFYRLFIVFDNGRYLFTPSRRPAADRAAKVTKVVEREDEAADKLLARAADNRIVFVDPDREHGHAVIKTPSRIHSAPQISDLGSSVPVFVRKGSSVIERISARQIPAFRDSILNRTRDTLVFVGGDTMLIKPFVAPEVYRVSAYVYTGRYGNVHVSLPDASRRHYSVRFFDDNNKLLFELAEIRDPALIVDKTNFQHSGWFRFELFDGDQLKERNKLFIPKEF